MHEGYKEGQEACDAAQVQHDQVRVEDGGLCSQRTRRVLSRG